MNDVDLSALPVFTPQEQEHHQAVSDFREYYVWEAAQKAKRAWAVALISQGVAVIAVIGVVALLLREQLVPMPLIIHDDGTMDVAWSWQDVLRDHPEATLRAWLWSWVDARVSYNYFDAPINYTRIERSSTKEVFAEYDQWIDPKNKESPQNTIGQNGGAISVEPDSLTFEEGYPTAYIRYWRMNKTKAGEIRDKVLMRATITYRINQPVPAVGRWFNPDGIVVTSFVNRELTPQ
jgi:type IV secretory pathway component VirB8